MNMLNYMVFQFRQQKKIHTQLMKIFLVYLLSAVYLRTQLKLLTPGTSDYAILEFLLNSAVGVENAKTWKQISEHLDEFGLKIPKNSFQNGLLQRSRRNPFYIGSCNKGFFIIMTQADVDATCNFYRARTQQELANWDALRELAPKADFANKEPSKDAA